MFYGKKWQFWMYLPQLWDSLVWFWFRKLMHICNNYLHNFVLLNHSLLCHFKSNTHFLKIYFHFLDRTRIRKRKNPK